MTEHLVEFLTVPLRVFENAYDGLADGRIESYALVGTALCAFALAAYLRRGETQSGFEEAVLVGETAPGAAWQTEANAAVTRTLESSQTEAASGVLTSNTPGGGE